MPDKVVPLRKPIVTHQGEVREVTLREPTGKDYLALGEVWAWDKNSSGETVGAPIAGTLAAYVERCFAKPGPEYLPQLGLADAIRIREEMIGFFVDAVAEVSSTPASS